MSYRISFGLLMLSILSACGFNDVDQHEPTQFDRPPGNERLVGQIAVTYLAPAGAIKSEDALLSSDQGQTFKTAGSITLPVVAPDSLDIFIDVPEMKIARSSTGLRAYGFDSANPSHSVGLGIEASSDQDNQIKVSGLRSLLSDSEEQMAILTIEVSPANGKRVVVEISARTPPSRAALEQMALDEYETRYRQIPKAIRTLKSATLRLDLLQVVQVTNLAAEQRVLAIPLQFQGKLWTQVDTRRVSSSWCGFSVAETNREDVLGTEFYLLPLADNLNRTFISVINDSIGENVQSVLLENNGSATFGIYGSGAGVANLMDRGPDRSTYESVSVTTGCRSRCGRAGVDLFVWDQQQMASTYWKGRGWPGQSEGCSGAMCSPFFPQHPYTIEKCNQCAEFELHNGTSAWDPKRFCRSPDPGNPWGYPVKEMWVVEKTTATVPSGTRNHAVVLEFPPKAAQASLRFVSSAPDNASEHRTLGDFLKSQVTQAE